MNLFEWDKQLTYLDQEVKQHLHSLYPSRSKTSYTEELIRENSRLENMLVDMTHEAQKYEPQEHHLQFHALKYWVSKYLDRMRHLIESIHRLGSKEIWMNILFRRYLNTSEASTTNVSAQALTAEHKKLKESISYLSFQKKELLQELQNKRAEKDAAEIRQRNHEAAQGSAQDLLETALLNDRALIDLTAYLNLVGFVAQNDGNTFNSAVKELQEIDSKTLNILEKCRTLVLDTLDFDADHEKALRRRAFEDALDKAHVLHHRLEKLVTSQQSPKIKTLHPILKKSSNQGMNSTAPRYSTRSLNDLVVTEAE